MDYDLAVIGSGWAGFNAALRAKKHGLRVALIEKGQIGGTCLNRGCIPTKALLQSAKAFTLTKKAAIFGIETSSPQINFSEIQARKNRIIQQLRQSMESALKGIDFINQQARILSANTIEAGSRQISAKFMLIASGSEPAQLPGLKFDFKKIISSNEILDLNNIPKSLLIIGGGAIGCEFASLFCAFGVQVSIVELTPQLLPGADKEIARKLESIFKKKGIKVATNTDANNLDFTQYELILLCIGRTSVSGGLGLDNLGVRLEKNRIIVDEYLRTSIPNIFAAGDCAGKICLAHFAAYQGNIAAANIIDPSRLKKADLSSVPSCIFTDPQIGSVGSTEEEARNKGVDIRVGKFDFMGSGMARILDETDGFIKIIFNNKTDEVIGASIIGPRATELIATLTQAVQLRLKGASLRELLLAHPSLSESISEAIERGYGI